MLKDSAKYQDQSGDKHMNIESRYLTQGTYWI